MVEPVPKRLACAPSASTAALVPDVVAIVLGMLPLADLLGAAVRVGKEWHAASKQSVKSAVITEGLLNRAEACAGRFGHALPALCRTLPSLTNLSIAPFSCYMRGSGWESFITLPRLVSFSNGNNMDEHCMPFISRHPTLTRLTYPMFYDRRYAGEQDAELLSVRPQLQLNGLGALSCERCRKTCFRWQCPQCASHAPPWCGECLGVERCRGHSALGHDCSLAWPTVAVAGSEQPRAVCHPLPRDRLCVMCAARIATMKAAAAARPFITVRVRL